MIHKKIDFLFKIFNWNIGEEKQKFTTMVTKFTKKKSKITTIEIVINEKIYVIAYTLLEEKNIWQNRV